MKKNITLLILVLIFSMIFVSCQNNEEATNSTVSENTENDSTASEDVIEIDKKVPDIKLTTIEGDIVSISDYEGKIIMLNFWATWCQYCVEEMPDFEIVNQEEDVVVLAINVKESKEIAKEYIDNAGYTFQIILDDDGSLSEQFLISAFPTTYFIDKDGILLGSVRGMLEMDQITEILDDIRSR